MQVDDDEQHDDLPDAQPEGGEPWPAWNPAIFVADNQQNQVMQHLVSHKTC
jgi:hypothetical protein